MEWIPRLTSRNVCREQSLLGRLGGTADIRLVQGDLRLGWKADETRQWQQQWKCQKAAIKSDSFPAAFNLYRKSQKCAHSVRSYSN